MTTNNVSQLTKAQESAILNETRRGWVGSDVMKIESNFAVVQFEDDEQSQTFKVYTDGKTVFMF